MEEQAFYELSEQTVALAWKVAKLSNKAYDEVKIAETELERMRALEDVSRGAFSATEADIELFNRQNEFDVLSSMAACVMKLPVSPFDAEDMPDMTERIAL